MKTLRIPGMSNVNLLVLFTVVAGIVIAGCVSRDDRSSPQGGGQGASGSEEVAAEPFEAAGELPSFTVSDTTEWDCAGNGGLFGVLSIDGNYVDTVDLYFDVQVAGDVFIFQPMLSEDDPQLGSSVCPAEPVIFNGTDKTPLADVLPLFNSYFSNPTSGQSALYYWGFGEGRLYAVRYDFVDEAADTTFLTDDSMLLATGNRYHFMVPEFDGDRIVFSTWPGRTFILNLEMQVVADSTVTR